ncbi:30S ribosomal protein S10 [endosymbiont GvMRE of Glomus versiforme]|uniref:30S ribosomal protein S10 n=1 Tax=endosymbiont GvMRE of Glomus versiforme TaxID=2039283 RepID=UPI000EF129E8|nr:30S ribosomal protein S10 [endosymbiont GvMRE of Glomus versiforme]RHZ36941.1 30S ribosomal protein S10 [endosymbiont GvMRE of Glomus versiforme]
MSSKLNILIEGFDVRPVEVTTAWILRKLLDTKIKFNAKGKVYLPNQWETETVLKSPHKHKKSQEHLGRIMHRRLIQVIDTSFADLNKIGLKGEHPEISRGVQVRLKV